MKERWVTFDCFGAPFGVSRLATLSRVRGRRQLTEFGKAIHWLELRGCLPAPSVIFFEA